METSPDFKTRMKILQAEIAAAKGLTKTEDQIRFLVRHPILTVLGVLWWVGEYIARAVFWMLILAGLVIGIKCCWLAIVWLWRLI